MRVSTIDERLVGFIAEPRQDLWLAIRQQLFSQGGFDPYAPCWQQLEDQFAAGNYATVLELAEQLQRFGCLSPRFHYLVGVAASEEGVTQVSRQARDAFRACLNAILDSGDGTQHAPYLSTYPWDCYDVLQALQVDPQGQQLVDRNGRWCDVIVSTSGDEFWFDVSDLLERRLDASDRLASPHASA